jgi:hypothetical protein
LLTCAIKSFFGVAQSEHSNNTQTAAVPNASGNTMTAYTYITLSLFLYPVIGRFLISQTQKYILVQRRIVWTIFFSSIFIACCAMAHIITISQNLNWFLITSVYLTVSVFLWSTQFQLRSSLKKIGKIFITIIFGLGYFVATAGFFLLMILSSEMQISQRKWLTADLIYQERNIGSGPDPSLSLKKIEVYRTVKFMPLIAYRMEARTYDTWNMNLKQNLDVSFSKRDQMLYLSGVSNAGKTSSWSDTICLAKRYYH